MVLVLKLILNLASIIIDINEFGGHFFILGGIFLLFIMLRVEAALFASWNLCAVDFIFCALF